MIEKHEISALMNAVSGVVRKYVGRVNDALAARIDELQRQFAAIPAGPRGERGEKGDRGPAGIRGAQGQFGAKGDRGPQGIRGDVGPRGERGEQGLQGPPGDSGGPGPKGDRGDPGLPGPEGARGEAGPAGARGADGAPGERGDAGNDGESGINGKDGAPGRSAYELACDAGFGGDQAEWLASLRGAAGRDGQDGAPGVRGDVGERGESGQAGERGVDGQSVTAEDFRQLFEAEYAKWQLEWERRANDRLDRAVAALRVPEDGFSLEDFSVAHDGDGNVTLRFARGELVKEFALRLPCFKDCGVYRDDEVYREGHGVTYAGSFWIAQKDDPQGRPDSGSGDFRLAVKRGRDGKDGVMKAPPVAPGPLRV